MLDRPLLHIGPFMVTNNAEPQANIWQGGATGRKIGASASPQPIGPAEVRRRRSVALALARAVGFVGRVEYRHVYSQLGGVQYGRGAEAGTDLVIVYAEAFDRDADPIGEANMMGA